MAEHEHRFDAGFCCHCGKPDEVMAKLKDAFDGTEMCRGVTPPHEPARPCVDIGHDEDGRAPCVDPECDRSHYYVSEAEAKRLQQQNRENARKSDPVFLALVEAARWAERFAVYREDYRGMQVCRRCHHEAARIEDVKHAPDCPAGAVRKVLSEVEGHKTSKGAECGLTHPREVCKLSMGHEPPHVFTPETAPARCAWYDCGEKLTHIIGGVNLCAQHYEECMIVARATDARELRCYCGSTDEITSPLPRECRRCFNARLTRNHNLDALEEAARTMLKNKDALNAAVRSGPEGAAYISTIVPKLTEADEAIRAVIVRLDAGKRS